MRSPRILAPLSALFMAVLTTGEAPAFPIDDFEAGPFQIQASPAAPQSASQWILPTWHCMAPQREMDLMSNGSVDSFAQLTLNALMDDEVAMVMPDLGGDLFLRYEPTPPFDLTAGGTMGRIDFSLSVAEPGAHLDLVVTDQSGHSESLSTLVGGPGTYVFYYTSFPSDLDLTDILRVEFVLRMPQGDFHIRDIRAMEATASPLMFNHTGGSPFRSMSVVGYDVIPVQIMPERPAEFLSIVLASAMNDGNQLPVGFLGDDSGDEGEYGRTGLIGFEWLGAAAPFPEGTSSFDVLFQISPPVTGEPSFPVITGVPQVQQSSMGFQLTIPVDFYNEMGQLIATDDHVFSFGIPEGQDLLVSNVQAYQGMARGDVSEAGVRFDLEKTGDVSGLIFGDASMDGWVVPATASGVDVGAGLAASADDRLWAQPSVTRGATDLRLSRAPSRAARIDVFDVTGRQVRELALPAGAAIARWDGRNRAGVPVAAGVYFARMAEGSRALTTKIVRIR